MKYIAEELSRRLKESQEHISQIDVNQKHVSQKHIGQKHVSQKYISKKQECQNTPYEIIFITNHPNAAYAPNNVRVLKTNSLRAIMNLATAKVWVDNNRKENYIRKRKGQYYIQTWHGGIALKKIEKDYEKLTPNYVKNAKRDSHMTDLYISNSTFCTNMYRKSFWYQGEIMECGSPRNDILLKPNANLGKEVRSRLGVTMQDRIAIYAPTYREGNNTESYQLDFEQLRAVLCKKFGGNWVVAVRLHPLVSDQSCYLRYNQSIIDASHYRDLYELMAVSDLLITDYSNIMFEFSFMKKPVFLYAKDEEEYTRERGFYFNYEELPYKRAKTQDILFEHIENYQAKCDHEKVQCFLNQLTIYETGQASEKVVDRILNVMKIKEQNGLPQNH